VALKVVTRAEMRLEVLLEAERTDMTVAEVCRRYGSPVKPITGIDAGIWLKGSPGWRTNPVVVIRLRIRSALK